MPLPLKAEDALKGSRPRTQSPNTSFIVNHPGLPRTQRAASRAPRAKAARSLAVCVSVIVSDGASNPNVCVPGIEPARVDVTSRELS